MGIAERLKERRKELGLTQVQVAEKAGVTQQAINSIEKGSVKKPQSIVEIAIALSCDPIWLKNGINKH